MGVVGDKVSHHYLIIDCPYLLPLICRMVYVNHHYKIKSAKYASSNKSIIHIYCKKYIRKEINT